MSCVDSASRTEIEAKIVTLQTQLTAVNAQMDLLLEAKTKGVESYRFDSNEGSQQAKRRKLEELTELISWIEARIDWYRRKLQCGGGLVAVNVRRI
jgi:Skp family chaperone for outer membrane proteins